MTASFFLFFIFRFFPGKSDHGAFLSCRAENPHLKENNAVEDQWKIKVQCKENNGAFLLIIEGNRVFAKYFRRSRGRAIAVRVPGDEGGGAYLNLNGLIFLFPFLFCLLLFGKRFQRARASGSLVWWRPTRGCTRSHGRET